MFFIFYEISKYMLLIRLFFFEWGFWLRELDEIGGFCNCGFVMLLFCGVFFL